MENVISKTEIATVETVEQVDLVAITELSAHDLALVGGGMANVVFM